MKHQMMYSILIFCLCGQIIAQQCNEVSISSYNVLLQDGLLPTNILSKYNILMSDPASSEYIPLVKTITNPEWTLTTKYFSAYVDPEQTEFTGVNPTTNPAAPGTITVDNQNIEIYAAFTFLYQTYTYEGLLFGNSQGGVTYTFSVATPGTAAPFPPPVSTYVSGQVDFKEFQFSQIYINAPLITTAQKAQVLNAINAQNTVIQQGIQTYYTKNNILGKIQNIINTYQDSTRPVSFINANNKINVQLAINYLQISYAPDVGYFAQYTSAIQNFNGAGQCGIVQTLPAQTTITADTDQAQLINMDLVANLVTFGLQNNYYQTLLNYKNWNIPFFSWTTGGLLNLFPNVYNSYPLNEALTGTCTIQQNTLTLTVNVPGSPSNTISVSPTYQCSVNSATQQQQIAAFSLAFTNLQVGLVFKDKNYYIQIIKENALPTITWNTQPQLLSLANWYVNYAVQNDFFNQQFIVEGIYTDFIDPEYTFTNNNLIISEDGVTQAWIEMNNY